jgi:hypothetical protein
VNRQQRRKAQRQGVPVKVLAFVESYRCGHCDSETAWPELTSFGGWLVGVEHDDTCPALLGQASYAPDITRAVYASDLDCAVYVDERNAP